MRYLFWYSVGDGNLNWPNNAVKLENKRKKCATLTSLNCIQEKCYFNISVTSFGFEHFFPKKINSFAVGMNAIENRNSIEGNLLDAHFKRILLSLCCCWHCRWVRVTNKFLKLMRLNRVCAIWFILRVAYNIKPVQSYSAQSAGENPFLDFWVKSTPNDRLFLLLWLYYFNFFSL